MSAVHSSQSEQRDQRRGGSGPSDALRVVLVGATGLDRTLRREPGIELIRARTPLLAIGELSQPIDDDSPSTTVVILGEGCLPDDHAAPFCAAVQRVEADAPIFTVVSDPLADFPSAFAGALSPSGSAEELRRAVAQARQGDLPSPASAPIQPEPAPADPAPVATPPTEAPQPEPDPASPRHTELPDDAKLVRAILAGRDIRTSCIEQLRHRSSVDTLTFIEDAQPPAEAEACPVVHRGHALGYLVDSARATPPQQLRMHAIWLGYWLALSEQQRQLREAAFTDALTGAWNRRYFDRYLESCLQRAAQNRQPVTVLLFDVDDFKKFNDCHGHIVGDEILRATVRLLKSCVRPADRVCRIGGDEFAVVFYEPDGPRESGSSQPTSIFDIARRFQQRVQTEEFSVLGSASPGPLAISGGLATFPWDGRTPQELLAASDRLLIESKSAGKNAIRYGTGVLCCDDIIP